MQTSAFEGPGQMLQHLLLTPGPLSPVFLVALLPLCAWASLRFPARLLPPRLLLHQGGMAGTLLLPLICLLSLGLCSIPVFSLFLSFFLGWAGLGAGALFQRATKALDALEYAQVADNLAMGQKALQPLLSQNLAHQTFADLYRLLATWLAEEFLLVFVYPLFWFALAGAPGLCCAVAAKMLAAAPGASAATLLIHDAMLFFPARISAIMLRFSYNHQYDPGGAPGGQWPGLGIIATQTHASGSLAWPLAAVSWLHHARSLANENNSPWLGPENLPDEDGNLPCWEAERLRALMEHLPRTAGFTALALAVLPLVILLLA